MLEPIGHPAHDLDAAARRRRRRRRQATSDGGQVGRLLRRAALAVDGGGRDRDRQAGGEPRGAGDVEGLHADLADAAADDLADLGRVDARAVDELPLHGGRAGRPSAWWTARRRGGRSGERTASTITTSRMRASVLTGRLGGPRRRGRCGSASAARRSASRSEARALSMPRRPMSHVRSSRRQSASVSRRASCRSMGPILPRGCVRDGGER